MEFVYGRVIICRDLPETVTSSGHVNDAPHEDTETVTINDEQTRPVAEGAHVRVD